ncbi:hypothetical protein B0W47_14220 [Komagataeibacter nataicola]|uniref:TonB-dependent receptor plug domain-containing protein n=1 Tax=Komagataeibacter nataicola TaxID=265960 RepID=A0A9N7CWA9_9PROT|nr:TonB-dependent receptor plug domain-containing protein [Komagataeibacter nataicola]AQU88420.1 hypothetical protein B0W47_14220 [Komagataeibacter nataicola]
MFRQKYIQCCIALSAVALFTTALSDISFARTGVADTTPKKKLPTKHNANNPQAATVAATAAPEAIHVTGATRPGNSVFSPSTREHSTVQVFRYDSSQLKETGQTNILAALSQLSAAVTSSPFGGMGSNGFNKTMQLRNLGADQTLMLVNGKRRHVDANFNYYQSGPNQDPLRPFVPVGAQAQFVPVSDHILITPETCANDLRTDLLGQRDAEILLWLPSVMQEFSDPY